MLASARAATEPGGGAGAEALAADGNSLAGREERNVYANTRGPTLPRHVY